MNRFSIEGLFHLWDTASYVKGEDFTVRYSATNSWIVNLNTGNVNNNNTNNRNYVVGASESVEDIDDWFVAERSFYKNKHDSIGAQRIHIHPSVVVRIAREVNSGAYQPLPGYCFPLFTPSPREIFAAFCKDRLVHHKVAPFISWVAEMVHNSNGDVSHGNRINHSAQTGAEQIRDAIIYIGDSGWILKFDIYSFFSSIPRQKAYDLFEGYARKYYKKPDIDKLLSLCRILILHNPITNCIVLGAKKLWERIPARKRLKNSKSGCGLPIGNFYSQLIAGLFLAVLDRALRRFGICPRFVDDKVCIVKTLEDAKQCLAIAKSTAESLGLRIHPDKIYIQPIYHGVKFCGSVIKGNRIYLSNSTINRIYFKIIGLFPTEYSARELVSPVNSYLGLMRHCTEYKNEKKLADFVLSLFGKWIYFKIEEHHFICKLKKKYKTRTKYTIFTNNLILFYYETCQTNKRNHRFN